MTTPSEDGKDKPHGPVSPRFMRHYYGAGGYVENPEHVMEDMLEAAYWEFDARRKGYSQWKGMPQSERDAFKAVARGLMRRSK